mmetsp:Transcript_11216/g.33639  ORF Transcript_11216/g.33639 Transcript_11216/m.33639 type:complete len:272 (+) Transcript_11216:1799-2614(+)
MRGLPGAVLVTLTSWVWAPAPLAGTRAPEAGFISMVTYLGTAAWKMRRSMSLGVELVKVHSTSVDGPSFVSSITIFSPSLSKAVIGAGFASVCIGGGCCAGCARPKGSGGGACGAAGGGAADVAKMSLRRSTLAGASSATAAGGAPPPPAPKMSFKSSKPEPAAGAPPPDDDDGAPTSTVGATPPSRSEKSAPFSAAAAAALAAAFRSKAGILARVSGRTPLHWSSSSAAYSQERCCSSRFIEVWKVATSSAVSAWPSVSRVASFARAVST